MEQPATQLLSPEKSSRLRLLIEHLNDAHGLSYKVIADKIGVNVHFIYRLNAKRTPGTFDVLNKMETYYKDNSIKKPSDIDNFRPVSFEYVLNRLCLDQFILQDSERKSAGRYILFSLLKNERIAVTWMELFEIDSRLTVPVFKARRPNSDGREIIYRGFYYEYMSSLFMFGHIEDTPLARTLILTPVGGARRQDRYGVMSGASPADRLFSSPCYLWDLDSSARRADFDELLGEQDSSLLEPQFPEAMESLLSRSGLLASVERTGG
ncbi:hypothetical protein [Chthonobacter rhizosphaerae]|uniref:hypothetical protein n=1 Tax=Chthonobacter rhizosphaerae TaxID=2735553 RepID=UPI0015EEA599|nr:hypothetical protein [Chthonobacter rhizosphaerae]